MASDPTGHRVVYLDNARRFLKKCVAQAAAKGISEKVIRILVEMDTQLKRNPREFGDPWNRHGNLEVYHRIFAPFDIVYAVHSTSNLVFVRDVSAYPSTYFA